MAYSALNEDHRLLRLDMERRNRLLARNLARSTEAVLRSESLETAAATIDELHGDTGLEIRWVLLGPEPPPERRPGASRETLESLRSGTEAVSIQRDGDRETQRVHVPVRSGGKYPAAIEVAQDLPGIWERRWDGSRSFPWLLAVLVFASAGVGVFGYSLFARLPGRARSSDRSLPVSIRGGHDPVIIQAELAGMRSELAVSKRRVRTETAGRVLAVEQLRHADKLTTVGRMSASISHELGTPLNVISGRAAMIGEGGLAESEITQSARIIHEQAARMTETMRDLLDFARGEPYQVDDVDLGDLIAQMGRLLRPLALEQRMDLRLLGVDEGFVVIQGDRSGLEQVVSNLAVNALDSGSKGGQVEIELARVRARDAGAGDAGEVDCAVVHIRDEGKGIADEDKGRVFEPFFTTKERGAGTGLGLSIVYGIVQEHGGWITLESAVGRGSCFSVHLPLQER